MVVFREEGLQMRRVEASQEHRLEGVPLPLGLRVDCSLAEFRLLVDEGYLGFVREAANAPGAFAVAFVPDEIKTLAGRKAYQLFRWGTVPSGTANVESCGSVHHESSEG